jgi:hypothetical protein
MILWGFIAFILIFWLAKAQRDHARNKEERLDRQRRQRVGLRPIPGKNGDPTNDLDAEEARLLAKLRERNGGGDGS